MGGDMERSGGITFIELLTVLLIGLKLTGYIKCSWLWVFAPILLPIALGLIVVLIFVIASLIEKATK